MSGKYSFKYYIYVNFKKLQVVGVEEVILEEEGRGQDVSRALYGQGGVGTEGDLDILVLPNRRFGLINVSYGEFT